jgi:SAM-dependent methyltransferase
VGPGRRLGAAPLGAASFSLVTSRFAFHHFQRPAAVLAEMFRVCAPGGRVLVADMIASEDAAAAAAFNAVEALRDPSHVRALRLSELRALFAAAGLPPPRETASEIRDTVEVVPGGAGRRGARAGRVCGERRRRVARHRGARVGRIRVPGAIPVRRQVTPPDDGRTHSGGLAESQEDKTQQHPAGRFHATLRGRGVRARCTSFRMHSVGRPFNRPLKVSISSGQGGIIVWCPWPRRVA